MTRFDFSPLFRSTVGFDRMMNLLEASARSGEDGYPPYNIEKMGENDYRITMAVAGFGENDLLIEVKDSTVTVSGSTSGEGDQERAYLHRGIAGRSFQTCLPAGRPCPCFRGQPGERSASHRPRTRSARGTEAADDQDLRGPGSAPDRGCQGSGLTATPQT